MESSLSDFESNHDKLQASLDMVKSCRIRGFHQVGWEFIEIAEKNFRQRKLSSMTAAAIQDYHIRLAYEKSILAFYVGLPGLGLTACEQIIHHPQVNDTMKQQTLSNLSHYIESLSHLLGYSGIVIEPLPNASDCQNDDVLFCCNPSVTMHNERIVYNIRGINYRFDIPTNTYFHDNSILTTNYLTYLEQDEWLQPTLILALSQNVSRPKLYSSLIRGYEDIRLFSIHSKLYGVASCREHTENNMNKMFLIDMEAGHVIRLHGYGDDEEVCQKNWSPLVITTFNEPIKSELRFVYSFSPFVVLKCDLMSGAVAPHQNTKTDLDLSSYRGGTQFIAFSMNNENGYIGVIHQVAQRQLPHGTLGRYYYHRFVFLTRQQGLFEISRVSQPFYFREKTIEFASGMVLQNNIFILTFGYEDNCAYQMKIPSEKIIDFMNTSDTFSVKNMDQIVL